MGVRTYTNGPCDYSVNIGTPIEIHNITGSSTVSGSITYCDQKDRYLYTASISGTYRFEIKLDAAAEVRIRISGENGKSIDYGSNALSIDLEAEKTYILSVEYRNGPCDYSVNIGTPIEIHNIKNPCKWHSHTIYRGSHFYLDSPYFDKFLCIHLLRQLLESCIRESA